MNYNQYNKLLRSLKVDQKVFYYVTKLLVQRSELVEHLHHSNDDNNQEIINIINTINEEIKTLLAL